MGKSYQSRKIYQSHPSNYTEANGYSLQENLDVAYRNNN